MELLRQRAPLPPTPLPPLRQTPRPWRHPYSSVARPFPKGLRSPPCRLAAPRPPASTPPAEASLEHQADLAATSARPPHPSRLCISAVGKFPLLCSLWFCDPPPHNLCHAKHTWLLLLLLLLIFLSHRRRRTLQLATSALCCTACPLRQAHSACLVRPLDDYLPLRAECSAGSG